MEVSQPIKDEDLPLIKDVMAQVVRLEANVAVGDALQILNRKDVDYGVVSDESGKLFAIVTREQLSAAKVDEQVQALTANLPHLVPIGLHDSLNIIVQIWGGYLAKKQNLLGIVVQEQSDVQGILLRETIVEAIGRPSGLFLSDPRTRGNPILDDNPKPEFMLYECPHDHEQRFLSRDKYNPRILQRCTKGHLMEYVGSVNSIP